MVQDHLDRVHLQRRVALAVTGNLRNSLGGSVTFLDLESQICSGSRVCVRILWPDNSAHIVCVNGIQDLGQIVYVVDPGIGSVSNITFDTLLTAYDGVGIWKETYFTKP